MSGAGHSGMGHPILFFDAECLLCSRSVQLLLRLDRRGVLRFAPLAGPTARSLRTRGLPLPGDPHTVVLLDPGGKLYTASDAVLRVCRYLPWPWRAAAVLQALPSELRDLLYRWIAQRRYRWFGTSERCLRSAGEGAARFLP